MGSSAFLNKVLFVGRFVLKSESRKFVLGDRLSSSKLQFDVHTMPVSLVVGAIWDRDLTSRTEERVGLGMADGCWTRVVFTIEGLVERYN